MKIQWCGMYKPQNCSYWCFFHFEWHQLEIPQLFVICHYKCPMKSQSSFQVVVCAVNGFPWMEGDGDWIEGEDEPQIINIGWFKGKNTWTKKMDADIKHLMEREGKIH
jgi:hypothetical protein